MSRLWDTEPALVLGVAAGSVAGLVSVGVAISTEQSAALYGLIASVLALGQALATRAQVVPAAEVIDVPRIGHGDA